MGFRREKNNSCSRIFDDEKKIQKIESDKQPVRCTCYVIITTTLHADFITVFMRRPGVFA